MRLAAPHSTRKTLSTALSLTLALGVAAPAKADLGDVVVLGILGTAAYCAANPSKCGSGGQRKTTRSGGTTRRAGPSDAIGLNREQSMWIQSSLQTMGFYQGSIDGSLGQGSRAAVRNYQTAIGANATGVMTAVQINDLIALSPAFVAYPADDPALFNADIAKDLDRDGVRALQAALNARGFDAGPVDGAMGGKTRTAIAAFKATQGLPGGPVASRRLLAVLNGGPAPVPGGFQLAPAYGSAGTTMASMSAPASQSLGATPPVPNAPAPAPATPAVAAPTPTPAPAAPAAPVAPAAPIAAGLDLLGVRLGATPDQVSSALNAELGAGLVTETAAAAAFGGTGRLSLADLAVTPTWPAAPAEMMLTVYDAQQPALGTIAAFRLIQMPGSVDEAVFTAQILPDIVAKYGEETRVTGTNTWISNPAARAAAAANPAALAACGALSVKSLAVAETAQGALWSAGGGPVLDTEGNASVAKACGEVMHVGFAEGRIAIGLWNSDALSGVAVVPAIKF